MLLPVLLDVVDDASELGIVAVLPQEACAARARARQSLPSPSDPSERARSSTKRATASRPLHIARCEPRPPVGASSPTSSTTEGRSTPAAVRQAATRVATSVSPFAMPPFAGGSLSRCRTADSPRRAAATTAEDSEQSRSSQPAKYVAACGWWRFFIAQSLPCSFNHTRGEGSEAGTKKVSCRGPSTSVREVTRRQQATWARSPCYFSSKGER